MNKRLIFFILTITILFLAGTGVWAASTFYINSSEGAYEGALSELYAIGGEGTSLLGTNELYALTGSGVTALYSETPDDGDDGTGDVSGDETLPDDNGNEPDTEEPDNAGDEVKPEEPSAPVITSEIAVKSNTVKVGLCYYYSAYRDSGIAEAYLSNNVGNGFAFGFYDDERVFNEVSRTEETSICLRITEESGIGVYSAEQAAPIFDDALYEISYTDKSNKLAVLPLCDDGDAITSFGDMLYYGGFEFAVLGGGKISVINVVDIEKYVMGVCASEMSKSWPVEALKAQAVAARTYVQKAMMSTTYFTRCGFDVTNDTYCQAYSGCTKLGDNIIEAVEGTANQYVTYNGAYIEALYFSSDGGATEDNVNVNGNNAHPYLKGVEDPYEYMTDSINYMSSWQVKFTPEELAEKMEMSNVVSVEPTYSELGNVIKLTFTSSNGQTGTLLRGSCRTGLGLYSIRYTVSTDSEGNFVFDGRGWGHNLGMSQFGAYSMAKYFEKTYEEILGFYYTGVELSYGVI